MGEESSDSTLIQENIEEFVNDDNKVVTYRWLSLTLNININIAKQALFTFATQQRSKGGNDDINVTYFVAGLGQTKTGDPVHKCVVVQEGDLERIKSSLSPVTSCHVYSVQKSRLKDYTALYQRDYDIINQNIDKSTSLSSIKCPWVSRRQAPSAPAKSNDKQVKKEEAKPSTVPPAQSSAKSSSSDTSSAKAKKPEPKGSIASMFASGGKKGQGSGVAKDKKDGDVKEKPKPAEQKKGVAAFFGKQKETTVKSEPGKSETQAKKSPTTKSETQAKKSPPSKAKSKPPQKNKAPVDSSDDEGPKRKRRRRIKTDLFDSSDEENEEEMEAEPEEEVKESVEEEEEEVKEVKSPPKEEAPKGKTEETKIVVTEGGRRRKRTRKLVPKQYVDDDGFMVTEKVWESDSTDVGDDEIEEERKKKEEEEKKKKAQAAEKSKQPSKAAPKKGTASPQKGKQTSLMSFFKKK